MERDTIRPWDTVPNAAYSRAYILLKKTAAAVIN